MTMTTTVLTDAYERISQEVHTTVEGLAPDQLSARVAPGANTIGWLVWHLTRVQDSHIADVADKEQVWISGGWYDRFGLPFKANATGYGFSSEDVGAVKGIDESQLTGYFDAVHQQTLAYVAGLADADLEEIVDTRWDPPVTLAARLVSVISDDLQHVGQAAYAKGLL
ncbi:MAG: DinB family protein [Actinomycetota bacterium]|nr:DinB family protein [Actinomycetota bacterium]